MSEKNGGLLSFLTNFACMGCGCFFVLIPVIIVFILGAMFGRKVIPESVQSFLNLDNPDDIPQRIEKVYDDGKNKYNEIYDDAKNKYDEKRDNIEDPVIIEDK